MTRSTGWLAASSSVGWLAACLPACLGVLVSKYGCVVSVVIYEWDTHTYTHTRACAHTYIILYILYVYIQFVCVHAHIHIYTSAATMARSYNGIPAPAPLLLSLSLFSNAALQMSLSPFLSPSIHRKPFYGTDAWPYTIIVAFCVGNHRRCRLRDSPVRGRRKGDDVTQKEKIKIWREDTAMRPLNKINTPEEDGSTHKVMFTSC